MHEIIAEIFVYVWGVWRHRWLALIVAWAVAIGGWIWVWQLPESYVASARVYVDTNSVLRPLLRGLTIQPNISQRISMLSRTLLSRPNLEKLMRMTDMDLEVTTEQEKEEMLTKLKSSISLSGQRGNASLYSIKVRDEDRDTARRIVQALMTVFIESSLADKRGDRSGAQTFLDRQISEYEQRLIEAESRLAKFKQENMDVLAGGSYYSSSQAARSDLEQARLQLSEMQNRQRELQRQLDGEDPVFISSGVTNSGSMTPLDSRIQSLRVELDQMLSRYTEKYPGVRQNRAMIADLEAEKLDEFSRLKDDSDGGYSGFSGSPFYQGMRTMLAETEAGVAELQVRVAEYERRVSRLADKANNVPEIEAQLKQLDRDYSVISGQHQTLLQRRETSRMSEDVEQNASDVTFRVIDPPFVPSKPSEPDKVVLNGGVLVFGIGAGVAVALLLALVSPVVGDPRTLTNVTGLPLLGSVTLTQQPEERRREFYGLATFATLTTGLLLAFIGLSLGQGGLFS